MPLCNENQWLAQFIDAGIEKKRAKALSSYAGHLGERGLPVIFSFRHLCLLFGVTPKYLASVVFSSHSHYREFEIPKRSGGVRDIVAPYPMLLQCQHWICSHILSKQRIHWAAHGYVKKRSIVSNAERHLNQKMLLKIDLKNFFPSLSIDSVVDFFYSLGYLPEIAFFLARICCLHDALPQGAATSPSLSNILLRSMDRELVAFSNENKVIYTRYADDLAFSGDFISPEFVSAVEKTIVKSGLLINPDKKRMISGGRRKIIVGIDVSSEKMRVPREYRRQVRLEAHLAIKLGAVEYSMRNERNGRGLLELSGRLAYWLQVEPDNYFALMSFEKIRKMLANEGGVASQGF